MYALQVIPSSWPCKVEAVEVCLDFDGFFEIGDEVRTGKLLVFLMRLWVTYDDMNLRYLNHF